MVSTSVGAAAPIGVEILKAGGNAIDAAVAVSFAAGVVHPYSSGIGGGGFILIRLASGERFAMDARETAPASAHADMYVDARGQVDPRASRRGGRAVAVPGLVQGLYAVQRRFGQVPWERVLEPAVRLCRQGVPLGVSHRRVLKRVQPWLSDFPETARIQLADGKVPELGWKLRQPELAHTLEAIARRGASALSTGKIAQAIVRAVNRSGGRFTLEDLTGYRTRWRQPVQGHYRGYEVISMPPPSSGGVHLIEMLHTIEPFDLRGLGAGSSETIHRLAEVMKLAFADRAVYLGDPDFQAVPVDWLISRAHARALREKLRLPPLWRRWPWHWGRKRILRIERPVEAPPDDAGTTHISVLDAAGNAVAITQTINTLFGSGITVEGSGIVLNNEMDDFSAAPGRPNAFGLTGSAANAIAPGKRPLSSMTPTIVLRRDQPWIVAGSPMGPFIISSVLLTLVNVIDFRMTIQQAVEAPRFHHQWRPDKLFLEPEHARDVVERLRSWGHPVYRTDFHFGSVAAVLRDPNSGLLWGARDPRRDAQAAGW